MTQHNYPTLTNCYATVSEFYARYIPTLENSMPDYTRETEVGEYITSACRFIDQKCDRHFYTTSSGVVRYFTPQFDCRIYIDDINTLTTLQTDDDQDGVYETTWTTAEYWTMPENPKNGEPYTWIEIPPWAGKVFLTGRVRSVKITGTWGWAAVPSQIKTACLMQSFRWYKRRDAPLGLNVNLEFGQMMQITNLDPDIEQMVAPFARIV